MTAWPQDSFPNPSTGRLQLLEQTFVHISGIGRKTEKALWDKGIRSWRDFLDAPRVIFSPGRDTLIRGILKESLAHLDDAAWFSERLPSQEAWRLFGRFGDRAAFLDIETAGADFGVDEITVIGLSGNGRADSFVAGFNLDDFEAAVSEYTLLVTFNGATFDLPFIRRAFPHISLPGAHIDLRYVLRRLGYSGGLKKIEEELGITRPPEVVGLSGLDAVGLWRAWLEGDASALSRLVAYNMADTVNLAPLMEMAYQRLSRSL